MSALDLNELMSKEDLKAFAAMWPSQLEHAKAEMRLVLDLVAEPNENASKYDDLLRNLMIAVVGSDPDLTAWIQAVAAGSFELRPEQRYAIPGKNERRQRFVDRGRDVYTNGTSALQQKLGITDSSVRDGINLIAISAVLKEFRNHATRHRALGPAWPVFVSVDNHLGNREHRQLYQFGDDVVLQERIAASISATLKEYMAEREAAGQSVAVEERTADWRRKLPPGADPVGYFGRGRVAVERYRDALASALQIALPEAFDAVADAEAIGQAAPPAENFPYWDSPDGTAPSDIIYTVDDRERLRGMLPLLTRSQVGELMRAPALRAYLRKYSPNWVGQKSSNQFYRQLRLWTEAGLPPPPNLRLQHAHLFEEEGCLLFFENPAKLDEWRSKLGMFPDRQSDAASAPATWFAKHKEAFRRILFSKDRE